MHIGGAAVKAVSRVADPETGGQTGAIALVWPADVVVELGVTLAFGGAALVDGVFLDTK